MRTIGIVGSESSNALDRANQLYDIYSSRGQAVLMSSPEGNKEHIPENYDVTSGLDVLIRHAYVDGPAVEVHVTD